MQESTIHVNIVPGGMPVVLHISQDDVGLRQYTFTLYSTQGTWEYVSGASATLEATKPDNHVIVHNCTYNNDGTITYTVQEQLAAVVGRVWSKLVIRDTNSNALGTIAIIWIVDPAGVTDSAIVSDSDISALQEFLAEFGTINAYKADLDSLRSLATGVNVASTKAAMTNHNIAYVYTGSESGMVTYNWYWYNGSDWVSGGAWEASVATDTTLTTSGKAADAKATGDAIAELKSDLDFVSNNIVANGYATYNGIYINPAQLKIRSSSGTALIVLTVDKNTDYVIKKATSTTMRIAVSSNSTPTNGDSVSAVAYHENASSDPLYINSGENTYMYIQLYVNSDSDEYRSVSANVKSLVVAKYVNVVNLEKTVKNDELKDNFSTYNIFDGTNYTELPLLYLNAPNGKVVAHESPYVTRTISVKINGGKYYRIWKNTVSVLRVTSGSIQTPSDGQAASVYATNGTASNDVVSIQTVPADNYLYIQLFADSDDASVRSVSANVSTLVIIEEPVNAQSDIPFLNDIIEKNHRGYQNVAPENTIPAFKLSRQFGYTWIETDVRFTSDNVAVIMHDESINRTARNADGTALSSTVNIADITYAQALTYDYGIWKSAYYAGTKIPTLAQALDLCKKIGLSVCLELKVGSQAQIEAIRDLVYSYGMEDNFEYLCNTKTIFTNATTYLQGCNIGLVGNDTITDSNLRSFFASHTGNNNKLFYHSDAYTSDSTRRAIVDSLHADGVGIVIRGNAETDITGAPSYTKRFITNALHPKAILYNTAMADAYTT